MVAQLERILQSVEVGIRVCVGGGIEVGLYVVLVISIRGGLLRGQVRRLLLRLHGLGGFLLLRLRIEEVCAAGREQEHHYDDTDDGAQPSA